MPICWKRAKPTIPRAKFRECCDQVFCAEVRPERFSKNELGIGGLPQQEVREALLAAGSDQKIDVSWSTIIGQSLPKRLI